MAANDVGHTHAMKRLTPPATLQEMKTVRAADREAQGVSSQQEAMALRDVENCICLANGRLTVVDTTCSSTSPVADLLSEDLGGPGYEVLLISQPDSQSVFAPGPIVERLIQQTKDQETWWGGALPEAGFWGTQALTRTEVVALLESCLTNNSL